GAGPGDGIAGLGVETEGSCRHIEFFARLNALREILRFRLGELDGFGLLQIGNDPVPDLVKRSLMRGLDALDREHDVAAVNLNGKADFALAQAEDGVLHFLGIAQFQDGVGWGDRASLAGFQMKLFVQVVQGDLAGAADGGRKLLRFVAGQLVRPLQDQRSLDGVLDLVEGFGVGGFLVEDLDDVEAILGLDQIGDGALGKAKCDLFKCGNGLTLDNPANVSALLLGAARDFGVGFADGHEENVLDVDAIRNRIILNILLVDGFELVVGNLDVLAHLDDVNEAVADHALFRDLIL